MAKNRYYLSTSAYFQNENLCYFVYSSGPLAGLFIYQVELKKEIESYQKYLDMVMPDKEEQIQEAEHKIFPVSALSQEEIESIFNTQEAMSKKRDGNQ